MKLSLDSLWMHADQVGDCMIWKHSCNSSGYPQACVESKGGTSVRRYIFTKLLGKTVPPKRVLGTLCLDKRCVSPMCLTLITRSKVSKDAYAYGKRNVTAEYLGRFKAAQAGGLVSVTPEQVAQIRSRPIELSHAEVAREFNLGEKCVSRIRRGVSHKPAMRGSSVFAWGGNAPSRQG